MIKVGIVGGTGYTGVELLRLLLNHPQAKVEVVTSRGEVGKAVADLFPNLRKYTDLTFTEPTLDSLTQCDIVFFATPNGTSMQTAAELIQAGVKIIDLAADFRLKDAVAWQQWYGMEHACPALLEEAVYGIPEFNRTQIAKARLVANPGCYPTAILLGLVPLLEAGIIDSQQLIADAKSGISGAGRKANIPILMSETGESFKAYNVSGHRHLPEILQELQAHSTRQVNLTFVPHLVPMIRGIEATLYATLTRELTVTELHAILVKRYQNEPFIDILPPEAHAETRHVRGANLCQLAVHRPQNGKVVVILSVIDNLVKGASGQAVQNMNIMSSLPETMGLTNIALLP